MSLGVQLHFLSYLKWNTAKEAMRLDSSKFSADPAFLMGQNCIQSMKCNVIPKVNPVVKERLATSKLT